MGPCILDLYTSVMITEKWWELSNLSGLMRLQSNELHHCWTIEHVTEDDRKGENAIWRAQNPFETFQ